MSDEEGLPVGLRDLAKMAARRGRTRVKRGLSTTRTHLERRQLEQDRKDFWIRLGKTAMQLTEDGDISHPEIDRAIRRIRELEDELNRLNASNASDDLASPYPSD